MQNKPSISRRHRALTWFTAVISLTVGLGVVLLLGAGYVYRHPETLIKLLQHTVLRNTSLSLAVGELNYGVSPGYLTAGDLRIESPAEADDITLAAERLHLDFSLSGPPGKRVLTVHRLQLDNFSLRIGKPWMPPSTPAAGGSPVKRILVRVFRYFVFSSVRLEDIRAINGRLSLEDPDRQLHVDRIDVGTVGAEGLQITGDVRAEWPAAKIAFRGRSFQIDATGWKHPDPLSLKIHFRLPESRVDTAQFQVPNLQAEAALRYDGDRREVAVSAANLSGSFRPGQRPVDATLNWRLAVTGTYATQSQEADLHTWRLEIAEALMAEGEGRARLARPRRVHMRLDEGRLSVQKLLTLLDEFQIPRPALEAKGQIDIRGGVGVEFSRAGSGPIRGHLTANWQDLQATYREGRNVLRFRSRGSLQARDDLRTPRFDLRVSADDLRYEGPMLVLDGAGVRLDLAGVYPEAVVGFRLDIPETVFSVGNRRITLEDIGLRAENGRIHLQDPSIELPDIQCGTPDIGMLTLALTSDIATSKLVLSGENSRILQSIVQTEILPAAWRFEARETFQAELTLKDFAPDRLAADVHFDRIGFGNPAGTRIAENIRAQMGVTLEAVPRDRARIPRLQLRATGGEILWDNHYFSLHTHPVAIESQMTLDMTAATARVDRFRIVADSLLSLRASGHAALRNRTPLLDFSVHIPKTELAPIFHNLVSEPYKYRYPALETLEIDGTISGAADIHKDPSGWSCRGRAFWNAGRLSRSQSGVSLSGISLSLPFVYARGAQYRDEPPAEGRLRIRQFSLPFVPQQGLDLHFDVYPDHSATTSPIAVGLPSGRAAIGPIRIENLFSADVQLETRLRLQEIAIDSFLKAVWPRPTGGVLDGQLTQLRFKGNHLTSRGSLSIEVFGGEIRLSDVGIKKLLGSAPTWAMDARILDLNLGQLTEETAFGRIQGILEGRIENLEIVNGQPQRFDLHLKTVKTEGVPRKIDVEAVKNIARLGGGQSPFIGLAGKVVAVFDEFYYQKMGVKASLVNDVFQVNGTIHEDGKEYLVKKGGIPGVDVVNSNPDNRISFKDMLKRVRRIHSRSSGPVIR